MKKNEELFYLIKSLSKSEKRYFKINSLGGDNTEYIVLFNAIEAQKTYDETAIKAIFKDKVFVNQLTTIKNYLKQRIFQSLRNYHSKLSIKTELIDILRNVEIMFHKGLYTICESELKRAEKKAKSYEENILLFQILDWRRKVHIALHPKETEIANTFIESQKNALNTTIEYTNLLLANTYPNNVSLSNKQTKDLQNKTLKTLHRYKKILSSGKIEKAKLTIEKLLKEWEQQPELLKEYFAIYFSVCNNYLAYLVLKKMYKEAFVRILLLKQRINELATNSASIIKETLKLYTIEIKIHTTLKDLHNTQEIIEDIQLFLSENKALINNYKSLYFNYQFALINFQKKDYKQSLYWLQEVITHHSKKDPRDILIYTHWLELIILYEQKQKKNLKKTIATLKNLIKKTKNIALYEHTLFQFLSKTILYTEKDKKIAFDQLHLELQNHPFPESILEYFNFYDWIRQKRS